MYRPIVASLLGLGLEGDRLHPVPCLPVGWQSFKIHWRHRETVHHIAVAQEHVGEQDVRAQMSVTVDGEERSEQTIPLADDHRQHLAGVVLRAGSALAVLLSA
ncbi:MAG: hypothetical protein KDI45_06115 [Candidatus Accumulibacter sp.]|nr:hypothetical protein [Accumulibacter sp.]